MLIDTQVYQDTKRKPELSLPGVSKGAFPAQRRLDLPETFVLRLRREQTYSGLLEDMYGDERIGVEAMRCYFFLWPFLSFAFFLNAGAFAAPSSREMFSCCPATQTFFRSLNTSFGMPDGKSTVL